MMTAIGILVVALGNGLGDVFLTRGMKAVGEVHTLGPRALLRLVRGVLGNASFLLGIAGFAVGFFAFLALLARADLSLLVPATALAYVVAMLGARLMLREKITRLRWAGSLLVCLGVALASLP